MDLILYAGIYVNAVQDVSLVHTEICEVSLSSHMPLNLFSLLCAKLLKSIICPRAVTHLQMHLSIPLMKQKAARESMQSQQENKRYKRKQRRKRKQLLMIKSFKP